MAGTKYDNGNGQQILAALTILDRYTNTRSAPDVRMDDRDRVIVYMNADSPKQQAKISKEDVARIEELNFHTQLPESDEDYLVFVCKD